MAANPHQMPPAGQPAARPLNPLAAGLANVARESGYEPPETLRRTTDTAPYIRPPSTTFGSR
jgi:hypothetical protein